MSRIREPMQLPAIEKFGIDGSNIMIGVKCARCVVLFSFKLPLKGSKPPALHFSTSADSSNAIIASSRDMTHDVKAKLTQGSTLETPQNLANGVTALLETRTPPTTILAAMADPNNKLSMTMVSSGCAGHRTADILAWGINAGFLKSCDTTNEQRAVEDIFFTLKRQGLLFHDVEYDVGVASLSLTGGYPSRNWYSDAKVKSIQETVTKRLQKTGYVITNVGPIAPIASPIRKKTPGKKSTLNPSDLSGSVFTVHSGNLSIDAYTNPKRGSHERKPSTPGHNINAPSSQPWLRRLHNHPESKYVVDKPMPSTSRTPARGNKPSVNRAAGPVAFDSFDFPPLASSSKDAKPKGMRKLQ